MGTDKEQYLRERYETLKLNDLREIAKKRGIKGATGMKKSEIIDLMCELDEKEAAAKSASEPSKDGGKEEGKASVQKPKKKSDKAFLFSYFSLGNYS